MKVQVKDIAKRAGVSSGTVSNALNHRKGISEEKRKEILAIAEEMGYTKHQENDKRHVIRFLILNKDAHVVGDTPFFSELIRGIEYQCQKNGYEVLMSHIYPETMPDLDKVLDQDHIDGILLLGTEMIDEDLQMLDAFHVPFVIVDTVFQNQAYDYVAINNEDGSYDIVSMLIAHGHQRIGIINSSHQINNFRERKNGYLKALNDHYIPLQSIDEVLVEPSLEGSYRDMRMYLKAYLKEMKEMPTAYFALNDNIAFGALKALQEIVPEKKISIVGFDDMPFCELCTPSLTTVKVDKQYLGKQGVERLIQKIENKDEGILKIRCSTRIVERKSVYDTKK